MPRGVKSSTFVVPPQYWDGCPSVISQISIQAAFVCPEWTWIFVDHNVMITFHVMALREPCKNGDLRPGSKAPTIFYPTWSSTSPFPGMKMQKESYQK